LSDDAILNAGGTKAVVERADAPTAKQIAVIWFSDEGLAPKTQGAALVIICTTLLVYMNTIYSRILPL
jgi:hypothetical protein